MTLTCGHTWWDGIEEWYVTLTIRSILSNLSDPCSASVVFFRQKKKDVTKFAFSLGTRYGEPVHPSFFGWDNPRYTCVFGYEDSVIHISHLVGGPGRVVAGLGRVSTNMTRLMAAKGVQIAPVGLTDSGAEWPVWRSPTSSGAWTTGVRCNMARSTGSRVKLEREGGRRERTRTHKLRSTVSGRDGPALVLEGRGTIS
jgi:hypothetical protein